MKLTNNAVLSVFSALNSLADEKFTAKLAWKMQTARTSLQPFVESISKNLEEVRTKYALRDEDGNLKPGKDENGVDIPNTVQIDFTKIETANKEIEDLLGVEVEVLNVELSIDDFPDSLEISPNTMAALYPILKK